MQALAAKKSAELLIIKRECLYNNLKFIFSTPIAMALGIGYSGIFVYSGILCWTTYDGAAPAIRNPFESVDWGTVSFRGCFIQTLTGLGVFVSLACALLIIEVIVGYDFRG